MDHYETVAKSMAFIKENIKRQPDLNEIAAHVCMSPFHFQRTFTEWAGVSPKQFLKYLTLQHAKRVMPLTSGLNEASYRCGLSGSSRLHDLFLSIEGMTPGDYKNHGEHIELQFSTDISPFGKYIVASTVRGICYLHFYQEENIAIADLKKTWPKATYNRSSNELHQQAHALLNDSLQQQTSKIKLNLKGTPFQLKVWEALLSIPEGHLTSYSDLANQIGQPTASRAVGTAIGSNPVAFLIPCHRVIKRIGGIGEYRWGSERKMAIIGWEASKTYPESENNFLEEQLPLFSKS
jgi:AraC family transcriptional regulator, regulatory protein of adaptative response / methylated-DNA-[protein]-cysteine methyltransferase